MIKKRKRERNLSNTPKNSTRSLTNVPSTHIIFFIAADEKTILLTYITIRMLKIRLSRWGRHKSPFYRIVLTEHTRPVKSGYKEVLGWFDPLKHTTEVDIEAVKAWIAKGARPSNRVAKLLFKHTGDEFFKWFIVESERTRRGKNAPEEPETPAQAPKEEAPKEEAPKEEA